MDGYGICYYNKRGRMSYIECHTPLTPLVRGDFVDGRSIVPRLSENVVNKQEEKTKEVMYKVNTTDKQIRKRLKYFHPNHPFISGA